MRCGRITVCQSIRELHQWLKRRMTGAVDRMDEMLDAIRPELETNYEDPPIPEVQKFFDMLRASEEPLHEYTAVSIPRLTSSTQKQDCKHQNTM
jgi:hypothetical protein